MRAEGLIIPLDTFRTKFATSTLKGGGTKLAIECPPSHPVHRGQGQHRRGSPFGPETYAEDRRPDWDVSTRPGSPPLMRNPSTDGAESPVAQLLSLAPPFGLDFQGRIVYAKGARG